MSQVHHIAYACNQLYAQYVAVSLKSLCDTQPQRADVMWKIHILTDGITPKSEAQLASICALRQDFQLVVHVIRGKELQGLPSERFTHITYFRFFIADLIPDAERVFYIDTDCLILDDISAVFSLPLEKTIAAVTNPFDKDNKQRVSLQTHNFYFIAAPLLINTLRWREQKYTHQLIEWCHSHLDILKFPDQDALNVLLQNDKEELPLRFNVFPYFLNPQHFSRKDLIPQIRECLFSPAIVHFASCAPWYLDEYKNPFDELWHATNQTLKHPAKITYRNKGWLGLKYRIKYWLFPKSRPTSMSLQTLKEQFLKISSKQ
jgi:hypothetical protein